MCRADQPAAFFLRQPSRRDDAVGLSLKLSDATSCLSRVMNFRNDRSKAVARTKGKDHKNKCQFHWDAHGMASMRVLSKETKP
jgi:hypothetical protein